MKSLVNDHELEQVGESLIRRYTETRAAPRCIDIEGFILSYLQLAVVYAAFAEDDRDKLGFVSDGRYPLKIEEHGQVTERVYPKGTVVIEKYLLHADNSGQRRFTLAHEAAHVIYERMSPVAPGPYFNRYFDREREYNIRELQERFNLFETQTDRLASVLLMPRFLLERAIEEHHLAVPLCIYGDCVIRSADKLVIQRMADEIGVSFSAFLTRLRELKYTVYRPMDEYIESEMRFGGKEPWQR